jgi:hypothetical protein
VEDRDLQIDAADFALPVNDIEIDAGIPIVVVPTFNDANGIDRIDLAKRRPVGSINPELDEEATYAIWTKYDTMAELNLDIEHGSTAGNIVHIDAPKIQVGPLTPGDRDDIRIYDVSFRLNRSTGADEFQLIFK